MKIIDKIKNLFKNKEKEEVIEEKQEIREESKEEYPICSYCNMTIFPEQRVKTFDGKKFHLKPCFRNLIKDAKKEAFK